MGYLTNLVENLLLGKCCYNCDEKYIDRHNIHVVFVLLLTSINVFSSIMTLFLFFTWGDFCFITIFILFVFLFIYALYKVTLRINQIHIFEFVDRDLRLEILIIYAYNFISFTYWLGLLL